jgi:hypothetical protein
MARYQLAFGMAGMAWFGLEGPPAIADYRIETDREYPVKVSEWKEGDEPWIAASREIGSAKVGGETGSFWVEFDAGAASHPTPRFYSVWRVEKDGVANLSEILMSTGPFGGR